MDAEKNLMEFEYTMRMIGLEEEQLDEKQRAELQRLRMEVPKEKERKKSDRWNRIDLPGVCQSVVVNQPEKVDEILDFCTSKDLGGIACFGSESILFLSKLLKRYTENYETKLKYIQSAELQKWFDKINYDEFNNYKRLVEYYCVALGDCGLESFKTSAVQAYIIERVREKKRTFVSFETNNCDRYELLPHYLMKYFIVSIITNNSVVVRFQDKILLEIDNYDRL